MILRDIKESTYLKFSDTKNIESEISKYIVTDYEYIRNRVDLKIKSFIGETELNPVILYGFSEHEKNIEQFTLPIVNKREKWIALDLRPFINVDKNNITYEIRNQGEYNLALQRFILTGLWNIENYSDLYSLKLAHFAFGNWLSDNLTKRFALSIENSIQIKVASYIYYAHLFKDNFNEEDFSKLVIRLKEDILSQELLVDIYNKTKDKYNSLKDFCEACYLATNNIKLKGMDENVLLNLTINNWIGIDGKRLTMLALEYPPIWISIVYAALTQKNFKKNYITNIIDRLNKRGKGDEFIKAYINITKQYLE